MNALELLKNNKHLIEAEKLSFDEPATVCGSYSGEYEGKKYWAEIRLDPRYGHATASGFAKSAELISAEHEFAKLYWKNSSAGKKGWDFPGKYIWQEDTCEECKKLQQQGILPKEEDFILTRLNLLQTNSMNNEKTTQKLANLVQELEDLIEAENSENFKNYLRTASPSPGKFLGDLISQDCAIAIPTAKESSTSTALPKKIRALTLQDTFWGQEI